MSQSFPAATSAVSHHRFTSLEHLERVEYIEWPVLSESVTTFAIQSIVETEIADKHGISHNFLCRIAILVNFESASW